MKISVLSCVAALFACAAFADGEPVNLYVNSDFNDGTKGWGLYKGAVRMETMALSGQWVIRALGPLYSFMSGTPTEWKAGEDYTLAIRARSVGSGSALRIVQMGRDKEGKVREGTYATMLTAVGPEFHEYWIPFRTSEKLVPHTIIFFKVDSKAPDTGLDIDSIRLFKGTIKPFEVRKIGRPGRQAPVAGTELKPADNPYGTVSRPLRAFVVASGLYSLRDADCLFAGTGVAYDQVYMKGTNEDVYNTDQEPNDIIARLKKGKYDVYVMTEEQRQKLGPQLQGMLATNLSHGAKLYTKPLRAKFANDRVGLDDFPYEAIGLADTLADIVRTVGSPAIPADARKKTVTRIYGGERHTLVQTLDGKGRTLDLTHAVEPIVGPKLGAYRDEVEKVEVEVEKVEVEKVEDGLTLAWEFADFAGRVLAKGEEISRSSESKAKSGLGTSTFSITLPISKLYTNLGLVRLALKRGDETLDRRTEATYARTLDLARVYDDYTPSMWPMGTGMIDADRMYAQLVGMGLRASQMPTAGDNCWPLSMRSGLAVGANSIGGSYFWLPGKLKTRARVPNVNTAEARKGIYENAAKKGRSFAKYGACQTFIQDEGELQRNNTDDEVDNHPENVAAYRVYMERKYKTIAEYNRRHLTAHKSFADLDEALLADARKSGNFAEFIEWRNFNVDRWCEAIKTCADGVRSTCPDVKVSLINTFGESSFSGNDYWKFTTKTGCDTSIEYMTPVYFGSESPINIFDEFYRSFRPDMRVWGYTGYFYTPERARILPWWTACHRYGGFTWFAATCWGYNLIDLPSYALTVDGVEVGKSLADSKMLVGLGKVLTCWEWAKRDIALYYSHDSVHVATCLGTDIGNITVNSKGPLHDLLYSRIGSQYLVENLLYQHDFVAPEQIVGEAKVEGEQRKNKNSSVGLGLRPSPILNSYKILFMAHVYAMSDAEVAAVKAFLAKGGKVVADILPGDYDELGVKRAANPFAGSAIEVTGANFNGRDEQQRAATLKTLEAAGATKVLASPTIVSHYGREAMHYVSGDADVYAVIRMIGRSSDKDDETFVFAKKGHVYDTIAGKYLGVSDRVTAKVPLNEGRVFAVLPAKIDNVAIAAPATVARGADLVADFVIEETKAKVEGEQGKVDSAVGLGLRPWPSYVLHVELVPPSGDVPHHFQRNLMTKDGKAHLDFPLAFNDETGTWKLRVTEVLSGVTAEKMFDVK